MRKILMASAAFTLLAGMAMAQTSTPAPEGAINAPMETPPGGSAGKTSPNSPPASVSTMPGPAPSSRNSATTSAPAPEGAINAPVETPPGGSAGKTAPAAGNNSQ